MRKIFSDQVKSLLKQDQNSYILLGDIGVGSFSQHEKLIPQVINMGINEQAMVSFAGGLSCTGKLVIVHTITAFLVERAYEQIKLTCGYNNQKLILVSANGPFDYTKLGPTHHSPADIPILNQIPNMNLFCPGTNAQLIENIRIAVNSSVSSYIRLTNRVAEFEQSDIGNMWKLGNNQTIFKKEKAIIAPGEAQKYVQERQLQSDYDLYAPKDLNQIIDLDQFGPYAEILLLEPYSESVLKLKTTSKNYPKVERVNFGKSLDKVILENKGWEKFDEYFSS